MHTLSKRLSALLLALTFVAASPAAMAELLTFNITWAPAQFGGDFTAGPASATATLTMDTQYISLPGGGPIAMADIASLSVTVTGASYGNGSFGKSDFSSLDFFYSHSLVLSGQLIGQYTPPVDFNDFTEPFGTDPYGQSGDFNLLGLSTGTAPSGVGPFLMVTNGDPSIDPSAGHDLLRIASIIVTPAAAVPEQSTYLMLLTGLALVGLLAYRRDDSKFCG